MKHLFRYSILTLLLVQATSCEKMLTVQAENQISDIKDLLQTPADARNVLNGAYDVLVNVLNGRIQNVNELLSDNLVEPVNNNDLRSVYDRSTIFFNSTLNGMYEDLYRAAFRSNLILDYAKDIAGISPGELNQLENEARFIRAISHFWVLKTYAQPWGYTANNSHLGIVIRNQSGQTPLPRSTVAQCYAFIQSDLIQAYNGLPEQNGYYATKYAAASLLAYTYFLQNDFTNCVTYCDAVINSGQFSLNQTMDTFHAWTEEIQTEFNPEMIFGSNSIPAIFDSRNGGFSGLYRAYSTQGATLSLSLQAFQLFANNPADLRNAWVEAASGQYQLKRFGTVETNNLGINYFDVPILRLTIVKLIRAEALAELGTNLSVAISDLNDIRNRAFIPGTFEVGPGTPASELITIARDEFRKETVGEGLYVDQLKRRGARGENIIIRGAPWNCPGMAIQFPNSEGTGVDFIFNPEGGCN